jgi:hypothetical protein
VIEIVLVKLCLDPIEDLGINDCLVLALVKIRLVLDLAAVDWVGQQCMHAAFVE